jgi:hypothetical protein
MFSRTTKFQDTILAPFIILMVLWAVASDEARVHRRDRTSSHGPSMSAVVFTVLAFGAACAWAARHVTFS